MGQCLKICEGTFCLKMAHSTAISGRIISILMLDQFSLRRKMRLERAHLMQPRAKPSELFLEVTTVLRCTVAKFVFGIYFKGL